MSRARWFVLAAAVLFTAIAAIWGTGVFGSLSEGGFEQPGSESQKTVERISDEIGRQDADLIALYSDERLTVDDAEFSAAVREATVKARGHDAVTSVVSYYDTRAPDLVSDDRHATYVAIRLAGEPDTETISEVRDELAADGLRTQVGGQKAIFLDVNDQVSEDIAQAEMISIPILLVLLVFVFGSLVAATTPLLVGGLAILGAFTVVRLLTLVTDVSVFSINIITILGLGLAVDYALFVVSRFREELAHGAAGSRDPYRPDRAAVTAAVARTVATAGRTVAVSGVTVALALSGLLLFPQVFLRSMGLGGVAAVAVAMLASLTVLPALLAVLGHRIDALRLPWARRRTVPSVTGALANTGFWGRIAGSVMRRPVWYAVGTGAVLLLLATPFAGVKFGGVDERVLPESTESRVVSERLTDEFPGNPVNPIQVLVSGAPAADTTRFAERIEDLKGVREAVPTANDGESTVITVTYDGAATSEAARQVVTEIRGLDEPSGADVLVGGVTANLVDLLDGLADRLPWMGLLVAGVTFVLLFLAFGSVVLPIKAIAMNVLSIGASFGAVVWIFQEGNLAGALDFTSTGFLEATQPILMLALLFGLSMDYEVFLLSRIREQWDNLGDNTAAVVSGVQRTGGIITAAALLLAVVVGAFATSGITFVKMIGVGMLVAVVLDATLVRLLLVPATMRLMGRFNWWAPPFLRGLYGRYGIKESGSPDPDPAPTRELAPVG
ncbi:MAG: MMPL family transporter [Micromonosporaceae bacterium]